MAWLNFSKDPEKSESVPDYSSDRSVLTDGSLKFTAEEGGNSSKLTYQEASGAPVERKSPLGYSVGWVTIIFLNLSKMVGTGIFSTRNLHSRDFYFDNQLIFYSINYTERCWFCW